MGSVVLAGENSSIPEATVAGALGVRLGGCTMYAGRSVHKPFLGTFDRWLDVRTILESIRLMVITSWLTLMMCLIIYWGVVEHGTQIR